jgi:hypothetical protein
MAWCLVKHRDNFTFTNKEVTGEWGKKCTMVSYLYTLSHIINVIKPKQLTWAEYAAPIWELMRNGYTVFIGKTE